MKEENKKSYPLIVRMAKDFMSHKKGDLLELDKYAKTYHGSYSGICLPSEFYDEAPHLFETVDISATEKRVAEGIGMTTEEFKKVCIYITNEYYPKSDEENEKYYADYLREILRRENRVKLP
jgi:hypothetical protein